MPESTRFAPEVKAELLAIVDRTRQRTGWTIRRILHHPALLVATVASFAQLEAAQLVAQPATAQASPTAWSAATSIVGVPQGRSLRNTTAVVWGDTVYVAANLFPVKGGPIGLRQLLLTRIPGGPLPLPGGQFAFAKPSLAIGRAGDLHMVWAEFASRVDTAKYWPADPSSLWHSVFHRGQWSVPKRILSGRYVFWADPSPQVLVDRQGSLQVAVVGASATGPRVLNVVVQGDAIRIDSLWNRASHVSVAEESGRLTMLWTGPDPSIRGDTNSVMVSHRTLPDGKWTRPERVRSLGLNRAAFLSYRSFNSDNIVAWIEERDRISTIEVWAARSGGPWRKVVASSLGTGVVGWALTPHPCGESSFVISRSVAGRVVTEGGRITSSGVIEWLGFAPNVDQSLGLATAATRTGYRAVFSGTRSGKSEAETLTTTRSAC